MSATSRRVIDRPVEKSTGDMRRVKNPKRGSRNGNGAGLHRQKRARR